MSRHAAIPDRLALAESNSGWVSPGRFHHIFLKGWDHGDAALQTKLNVALRQSGSEISELGWREEGLVVNFPSENDMFMFKLAFEE